MALQNVRERLSLLHDIVSFYAVDNQQRNAHGADDGVQRLHLRPQFIRHGRAVGFVFGVHGIAEGVALGIKHYGHGAVGILLAQTAQHIYHAFDGASRLAFRGAQRRQRVKGAVEIG